MLLTVILAFVATIALGQILFKLVALELGDAGLGGIVVNPRAAVLLAVTLTLYAGATLAWIWILRQVPLSRAYVFMSLSFVVVPLLAHVVLREQLSPQVVAGALLIVAGVAVTARGL
jgi:undecaprenyl phosphate-alpha-L-ara4N flippase subunit ArnE